MPLADGALTVTLGDAPRVEFELDEVSASLEFTGRFGVFDFADGPLAPGPSTLGDIGRHVFPFNHYEQGLDVRGVVRFGGEEVGSQGAATATTRGASATTSASATTTGSARTSTRASWAGRRWSRRRMTA